MFKKMALHTLGSIYLIVIVSLYFRRNTLQYLVQVSLEQRAPSVLILEPAARIFQLTDQLALEVHRVLKVDLKLNVQNVPFNMTYKNYVTTSNSWKYLKHRRLFQDTFNTRISVKCFIKQLSTSYLQKHSSIDIFSLLWSPLSHLTHLIVILN